MIRRPLVFAALALPLMTAAPSAPLAQDAPAAERPRFQDITGERVVFPSVDEGRTELVGYLYRPDAIPAGGAPAVVLLHGRGGLYSSRADGVYDASTLTLRLKYWADYWAARGYHVLIVDSFGPRGYVQGFAAGTYAARPPEINEVTIRPMDAYGALRYLRGLDGVADDRIGVMGFSNGGSAVLAAMADDKPGDMRRLGFRAGIAMYPGCGLQNRFRQGYRIYAPVQVFIGDADQEVSAESCRRLIDRAATGDPAPAITVYRGAAHGFDDPSRSRQAVAANASATQDVRTRLERWFAERLAPR